MKLKKVSSLCCQTGVFSLLDAPNDQWLGDGFAFYQISGLPYMDIDNICVMFDIPEKKQQKLDFYQKQAPEIMNFADADGAEWKVEASELCVRFHGMELIPLQTSKGIAFIQEKYLTPLDNLDYFRLYERKTKEGSLYLVGKIGLVIQAVIPPVKVITSEFVEQMEYLTAQCRAALQKHPEQNRLLQVDERTGEVIGEDSPALP